MRVKFPDRLKRLIEDRNLYQRDVANDLGLSDTAVSQYVTGKRQPDFETVVKIAGYFDVTIDYLLGVTNDPKKSRGTSLPADWEETIRNLRKEGISAQDIESAIELIKTYKKMREG